jgi:hypothetical protein
MSDMPVWNYLSTLAVHQCVLIASAAARDGLVLVMALSFHLIACCLLAVCALG